MLNTDGQTVETHIEVTPQLLAVFTIERLANNLNQLSIEPSNWWFVIQDFDLALMAQLIASLSGTAQLGALEQGAQRAMLTYLEDNGPTRTWPIDKHGNSFEDKLAGFAKLLNRALDPHFPYIDNSQNPLVLSREQKNDILKLHKCRNSLAHVRPLSWNLEVAGLPRMAMACTYAIKHLFRHSTQRIHLNEPQVTRAEASLAKISHTLKAMN